MKIEKENQKTLLQGVQTFYRRSPIRFTAILVVSLYALLLLFHDSDPVLVESSSTRSLFRSDGYQQNNEKSIQPTSCATRLAERKGDMTDPNNGIDESPKKYVEKTDPNFWISLHKQFFDPMRWASIMERGEYYETGLTNQFQQILGQKPERGMVIDVGMNIGWFTLYSRSMGHDVVSFDPNPIMHTRVCESLQHNGWLEDQSVVTFPYGLGHAPAELNLTMGKNPGGSSFNEDRLAKRYRKYLTVPVTTLDDVAQQEGWLDSKQPIYLMKVDVEGYEPYVFQGATKLVNSGRIQNIILESSARDLRLVSDLLSMVYHAGYKVNMISDENGKVKFGDMIPALNAALESSKVGEDLDQISEQVKLLAKINVNMWWTKI